MDFSGMVNFFGSSDFADATKKDVEEKMKEKKVLLRGG